MKKVLSLILTLALILSVLSFAAADDLPTITIMFHGSNVTDDKAVLEKVNEYIADKVGAKLEVIWGTWGDFDEKSVKVLEGADKDVDIVFTSSWSDDEYNSFAKKGYFLKLDDLFAQYGADLIAALPEDLMKAATIEGAEGKGVYAVNGFKDTRPRKSRATVSIPSWWSPSLQNAWSPTPLLSAVTEMPTCCPCISIPTTSPPKAPTATSC